ncbi:MAG TPA: tRNA (guanosine(37)-N1)-methyltransferase TrmD [Clostridiales bacterium]|nr:tRNA (guanosine(37)-N1)-methyltransferase TrmD [Clostridiales bacterium]
MDPFRFDILTLFPDMFPAVLGESIIGRAEEQGILMINPVNIRDFSKDRHKKTDDYPYGGGNGLVMLAQPIYDAWKHVTDGCDLRPMTIYLSPQGRVLDQQLVIRLTSERHLVLLCGHYEGVDERVLEEIVDMEVSIGDYVLTGGEIAAMVLVDAIARQIPGVLSNIGSAADESHANGLLEYPQYTRPRSFLGKEVPEVLLSGHHANIDAWRTARSLQRTRGKRPDLYEAYLQNRDKHD